MFVNYTCTSKPSSAQLFSYAARGAGVAAFSTGGICFVLQGQTQHMATANGGYFRENLSLFWEHYVIMHVSQVQPVDVAPFSVWENSNAPASQVSHPLATRWHAGVLPQGSGSQELEHGQRLQRRGTCLQGLHIGDTTAFIFQGIVSKKYDWCLFLFPSIVRFLVPYC